MAQCTAWSGQLRMPLITIPMEIRAATTSGSRVRDAKTVRGTGPVAHEDIVSRYETGDDALRTDGKIGLCRITLRSAAIRPCGDGQLPEMAREMIGCKQKPFVAGRYPRQLPSVDAVPDRGQARRRMRRGRGRHGRGRGERGRPVPRPGLEKGVVTAGRLRDSDAPRGFARTDEPQGKVGGGAWLLIEERDGEAGDDPDALIGTFDTSVSNGRGMEEIARIRRVEGPRFRAPQLATLVEETSEGKGRSHGAEPDGYRALAAIGTDGATMWTRVGKGRSGKFAARRGAADVPACGSALRDGEVMSAKVEISAFSSLRRAKRPGRIFVDRRGNERGATAGAPYSPRAREGAPLVGPVTWDELESPAGEGASDTGAIAGRPEAQGPYSDPTSDRPWIAGNLPCAAQQGRAHG